VHEATWCSGALHVKHRTLKAQKVSSEEVFPKRNTRRTLDSIAMLVEYVFGR
jgi:hypothetical protein